jgi:signal transduction histidine kinase
MDESSEPPFSQQIREVARLLNESTEPPRPLDRALRGLAGGLAREVRLMEKLQEVLLRINEGRLLDEVMNALYDGFKGTLPYDRIGLALVEDGGVVRARWAKTDLPVVKLPVGYAAALAGSSLEGVLRTGRPRVLNDLSRYLEEHPASDSTRLVVEEGIRASLTCPLIVEGKSVGFLFFSSRETGAYEAEHVDAYRRLAAHVSLLVEKGAWASRLAVQKDEIEKKNAELRRLNDLKNTFLGIAAHDLRNPVGLVQMIADSIIQSGDKMAPETRRELIAEVGGLCRHALALLNDLLDVAQIESGVLEIKPASLDPAVILRETAERHGRLATPKGTRIEAEPPPPGAMRADPLRLRQVLDNLVSNAVKYSPPGSTVRIRAKREGAGWRVEVTDQGPGLTEEDRQRLFQDFARLSAKPTGGEKSTGLGLAITRRMVEAHGGKIGVDSRPGAGATFFFTLPD